MLSKPVHFIYREFAMWDWQDEDQASYKTAAAPKKRFNQDGQTMSMDYGPTVEK